MFVRSKDVQYEVAYVDHHLTSKEKGVFERLAMSGKSEKAMKCSK